MRETRISSKRRLGSLLKSIRRCCLIRTKLLVHYKSIKIDVCAFVGGVSRSGERRFGLSLSLLLLPPPPPPLD